MNRNRMPRTLLFTGAFAAMLSTTACDELLLALVTPCDFETEPTCEDPERGNITGLITVPRGSAQSAMAGERAVPDAVRRYASALVQHGPDQPLPHVRGPQKIGPAPQLASRHAVDHRPGRTPHIRAGELIVGLEAMGQRAAARDELAAHAPANQVSVPLCNAGAFGAMCLVKLTDADGKRASLAQTHALIDAARAAGRYRYVEPNLVLAIQRAPNDDFYPFQWHYQAMNLEGAWDITVGSDDVVAAVIDTGLLTDHPDLDLRIEGTVDLIEDADVARDGDGRDENGFDDGDENCGADCHSHHGSHVAGTMGAKTNNASMISGVTWRGRLIGVRVLGKGGGSLFDIASGVLWSVGGTVEGVAANPTPADVLNLSLGGRGESEAMNEAIQGAIDAGAIVVVAAGNDDVDAEENTPANSPGAITVAALGQKDSSGTFRRAPYSNFGAVVDLAAPGGDLSQDADGDGHADGVLSTVKATAEYYQGTSMAAPHVAGLAMLLKSQKPEITQAEALDLLASTSKTEVVECGSKSCGAGLVDAARALLTLDGRADEPLVVAGPAVTRVGRGDGDARIAFENVGGSDVVITLGLSGPGRTKVTSETGFGVLDAETGVEATILAGGRFELELDIERIASTATGPVDDTGEAIVSAAWGGQVTEANVKWSAAQIVSTRSVLVGALKVEDNGDFTVERGVTATEVDDYAYKLFNLTPGNYIVIGLTDDDDDGEFEENEGLGAYPIFQQVEMVAVTAGQTESEKSFIVTASFDEVDIPGGGDGGVGAACGTSDDCEGDLYCEPVFAGGYCTLDCLGGAACPGDGVCFQFEANFSICLDGCASIADCRESEGYICDSDNTCYPE